MAKENKRIQALLQREIALILQQELRDPRLSLVTVSDIELSRDMKLSKVYVTFMNIDHQSMASAQARQQVDATLKILRGAAGFIRSHLARRLDLRSTPHLQFFFDPSVVEGDRIAGLIATALAGTSATEADDIRDSDADVDQRADQPQHFGEPNNK